MLTQLLEHAAILAVAVALLGVPGAALASLLRIRVVLPDALAVPAAAMLGALVACVATFVQLILEQGVEVAVGTHVALSLVLAAGALLVQRRRVARDDATIPFARGWDRWTTGLVVVAALFAWAVRGAIRLDGLYHVALSRKLVELDAPNFDNVNRFVDGGPNPTYALPGWHAFVGWCGWITGIDATTVWEIMPVLVVALGALAAAGLAHVLLGTRRATALGALAWVLMRVLYARREVDGDAIRYGAVPGQVVFELILPVLFASIAVAMWTESTRVRRASHAISLAAIASSVIYHANYLPYVVIVGLGYAAWWIVAGPFADGAGRRLVRVGIAIAVMCAGCMAVVLPLLARLENFGAPDEGRIDYHLTTTAGFQHIRGGHVYEMLGLPGLLALLLMPWVAWRWRSRAMAVVSGGLLALLTTCFVPPLFEVLRRTGSLTIGLRINHVIGGLLAVVLAAAVLLVADDLAARGWSRRRLTLVGAGALVAFMAVGVVLGYDRFSPDLPGYGAWLALIGVWVARLVQTRRARRIDVTEAALATARSPRVVAPRHFVIVTAAVMTVGLALPVGAISARRAVLNADSITAGRAVGELDCLSGPVERALRDVDTGTIILSDPATSFRVMALAPVYVVGDYKVWNGADRSEVRRRLASVNRFFDSSLSDYERLETLKTEDVEYLVLDTDDGRWITGEGVSEGTRAPLDAAWSALDSFADVQSYDGGGIGRLISDHPEVFEQVAFDERATKAAQPPQFADDAVPCNAYGIWRVDRGDIPADEKGLMTRRGALDGEVAVGSGSVTSRPRDVIVG